MCKFADGYKAAAFVIIWSSEAGKSGSGILLRIAFWCCLGSGADKMTLITIHARQARQTLLLCIAQLIPLFPFLKMCLC